MLRRCPTALWNRRWNTSLRTKWGIPWALCTTWLHRLPSQQTRCARQRSPVSTAPRPRLWTMHALIMWRNPPTAVCDLRHRNWVCTISMLWNGRIGCSAARKVTKTMPNSCVTWSANTRATPSIAMVCSRQTRVTTPRPLKKT